MARVEDRTVGFTGNVSFGHAGVPSGAQIGESKRISGYALANPSYARQAYYDPNFNQGNVFEKGKGSGNLSYAAARSGVVNPAGYGALPTKAEVNARHGETQHPWAPMGHSNTTGFNARGGRAINPMLRFRMSNDMFRSTGWAGLLTQSSGPNKAFALGGAGRGQSSEDTTKEMYRTIETRMGTRAQFTDEVWNAAKTQFGRTWAGYKTMGPTGGTPFLHAQLGQMFKRENPNVGFARRVKRGL